MIYIGIGSNLSGLNNETPVQNCQMAIHSIQKEVEITKISSFYESQPIPLSNQPWYVNGIAEIITDKSPIELLNFLIKIEKFLGRIRKKKNDSRIIDLDIVDYKNQLISYRKKLIIPHPRMHKRAFVLLPLQELNPQWEHPKYKIKISKLIKEINTKQKIVKLTKY